MELFDGIIAAFERELAPLAKRSWAFDPALAWPSGEEGELVLRADAAFELGAAGLPAPCCSCVTGDERLAAPGRVELYGPDLGELRGNAPYARLVFAHTAPLADDGAAYETVNAVEFVKYGLFPRGFMLRSSAVMGREQVRVASRAIAEGISFAGVGALLLSKLREIPAVRGARVVFVTDPAADYGALAALCQKAGELTAALNHIMDGLELDCAHCGMKPICDEVEGMKALHQKKIKLIHS